MKVIRKQVFTTILAILCCAAMFLGVSFLMLRKDTSSINATESHIPYAQKESFSMGLLFDFIDDNSVFLNFDNTKDAIPIIILPNNSDSESVVKYGYTVFKTIKTDHSMLEGFIDRIGGIELGDMRYTGVQITELLAHSVDIQLRRDIIAAIFKKISQDGLKSETLVYIIDNSQTDFSFPDGYALLGNIQTLAKKIYFVN